jgi:hypothetical protein
MYSSGNATSSTNLLNAFRLFLIDAGWTVNRYADDGNGKSLSVEKNGLFFNFRSTLNEPIYHNPTVLDVQNAQSQTAIWISPSTGFDAGQNWFRQPNAPKNNNNVFMYAGIGFLTAAVNYHFFAFNDNAFMIVENPVGRWHWAGIGKLAKIGDWGGGQFVFAKHINDANDSDWRSFSIFGSNWFGYQQSGFFLRVASIDGFTGWSNYQTPSNAGNLIPLRAGDTMQKSTILMESSPNAFNSLAVRLPVGVILTRDAGNNLETTPFSLLGYIDEFFFVNIRFMNPGSIYSIGGVNYKVFSFHTKADERAFVHPNNSTGNLGFCLKTD